MALFTYHQKNYSLKIHFGTEYRKIQLEDLAIMLTIISHLALAGSKVRELLAICFGQPRKWFAGSSARKAAMRRS